MGPESANHERKDWLSRLWPLGVLAIGLAAIFAFDLDNYLSFQTLAENREKLVAFVESNRVLALGAFMLAYAVSTALSVPGGVFLTLAGGFLFGIWIGTVAVVIAATAGATALFLIARSSFGDLLRIKAGPWLKRLEAGFRRNAFNYLLVLRLVPLFPFWLVNLVPAFLGVPLRTYVAATALGIIPGSFVYASVGNGLGAIFDRGEEPDLGIIFTPEVLLPILGLAALALLPVIYKAVRGKEATL